MLYLAISCVFLFYAQALMLYTLHFVGEVAEWSKAPHSKCGEPKGSGGSNPSLSARYKKGPCWGFFVSNCAGVRTPGTY